MAEGVAKSRAGQDILNQLEELPLSTIAVIDGVALGGGCELAFSLATVLPLLTKKFVSARRKSIWGLFRFWR